MGKKKPGWFRRIFGGKGHSDLPKTSGESSTNPTKDNSHQWPFANSQAYRTGFSPSPNHAGESPYTSSIDASKHAIVVAAATAAVAEAAVAAAKAAAEVVRLTSGGAGRCTPTAYGSGSGRYWDVVAAVKIQSAFRAYLARRALRALKALVKLQALVRGHIVRKQTANTLRRMQALVRVQARARASRAHMSESSQSSSKSLLSHHLGSASPVKYEHQPHANSTKFDQSSILKREGSYSRTRGIGQDEVHYGSNWLDRWMKESPLKPYAHDEETDKILEVDTWKPHLNSKPSNRTFQKSHHGIPSGYYDRPFMPFYSPSTIKEQNYIPNIPFVDSLSLSSLNFHTEKDEATSWAAENSPQVFSASSRPGSSTRRSAFSSTRNEFQRSFFNGYSDHPNYMANTESYRAKVRSQSAPRQRIELEKYGSTRRSVHGFSNMMTTNKDYADFRRS